LRRMARVTCVETSVWLGSRFDSAGTSRTSSKVSPSRIFMHASCRAMGRRLYTTMIPLFLPSCRTRPTIGRVVLPPRPAIAGDQPIPDLEQQRHILRRAVEAQPGRHFVGRPMIMGGEIIFGRLAPFGAGFAVAR